MQTITRDEAIREIKRGLETRSGKRWSVTGGKGTEAGWIRISTLPGDRNKYGYISEAARKELANLLGLESIMQDGCDVAHSLPHYQEYIDRANGRTPSIIGKKYWD